MTLAFQAPYKPTPKLILLALCDFSNDKGISFPSRSTLMEKSTVSKSTLHYVLDAFEEIKLIQRERRKRKNNSDKSSIYYVQIEKLLTISSIEEKYNDLDNIKSEKKKYLNEYESAYNQVKSTNKRSQSDHSKNHTKNIDVTTRGHSSDHLEPSINHQELSKDISSSKKKENYKEFRERIKNNYSGYELIRGAPGFLKDTVISLSHTGYLHNEVSCKDLNGEDAKIIWTWLFTNPHKILPKVSNEI